MGDLMDKYRWKSGMKIYWIFLMNNLRN
jgi:hypothetical protein